MCSKDEEIERLSEALRRVTAERDELQISRIKMLDRISRIGEAVGVYSIGSSEDIESIITRVKSVMSMV